MLDLFDGKVRFVLLAVVSGWKTLIFQGFRVSDLFDANMRVCCLNWVGDVSAFANFQQSKRGRSDCTYQLIAISEVTERR